MKMEDCNLIRELMQLCILGRAGEETVVRVKKHLRECPECAERMREMYQESVAEQEKKREEAQAQRRQKRLDRVCFVLALVLTSLVTVLALLLGKLL